MHPTQFETGGGVRVSRTATRFDPDLLAEITGQVEARRGGVLSSGMEYPGRYSRWHMAYVDPCVELVARGRQLTATALNERGRVLLPVIGAAMRRAGEGAGEAGPGRADVIVPEPDGVFAEEERSRRPTVFSALREVIAAFSGPDPHLGLYGAFGYDLAFQFEPLRQRHARPGVQRDLVLHLPDQLYVLDRKRETATCFSYDFEVAGVSTAGLARDGDAGPAPSVMDNDLPADPRPGSYAAVVEQARERFARGDLFEVVPSHVFHAACDSPAAFYERLRQRNPAPYEFFLNLGEGEFLVGASPEMYVRVTGDRVETCPIAGTIARGGDPLQDAENIRTLLSSAKDESELTMCTDVDRNDKSRICEPGSVRVIGRRQIEIYSRLIHTVDHVEGRLRPGFDALDAFLTHMWAVTVTGAPKAWAMQFIEDHERSARGWYGGAVGLLGFDGNLNTGLTLRTIHIKDGVAEVRVGATLLYDSDPDEEERETHLKAAALLDAIRRPRNSALEINDAALPGRGKRILLVDHQDSFVHTLGNYLRQTGAEVDTLRAGFPPEELDRRRPDLIVLSPGPGSPKDFGVSATIASALSVGLPIFGVCLGLQGMVEYFGGELGQLSCPVHGKASRIHVLGGRIFQDFPCEFTAGRYHSLYAVRETLPPDLRVTAESEDGVIMGIEHVALPLAAVQFHPESILTLKDNIGLRLVRNVLTALVPARTG